LTSTPTVSFGEESFDHGEVILAAVAWGEWQALALSLAADLVRVAAAERRGERPDVDAHPLPPALRKSARA